MRNKFLCVLALVGVFGVLTCKSRSSTNHLADASAQPAGAVPETVFQQLIAATPDGKVPYPFSKLVEHIARFGTPNPIVIPVGRSLQATRARPNFFLDPRRLVSVSDDKGDLNLKERLFVGHVKSAGELEVIAFNENKGIFEFLLVQNYRDGGTPVILAPKREECLACHQGNAPIFQNPNWEEVVDNLLRSFMYRHHPDQTVDGISLAEEKSDVRGFDIQVRRAAHLTMGAAVWRDLCSQQDPLACRLDLFRTAARFLIRAECPDIDTPACFNRFIAIAASGEGELDGGLIDVTPATETQFLAAAKRNKMAAPGIGTRIFHSEIVERFLQDELKREGIEPHTFSIVGLGTFELPPQTKPLPTPDATYADRVRAKGPAAYKRLIEALTRFHKARTAGVGLKSPDVSETDVSDAELFVAEYLLDKKYLGGGDPKAARQAVNLELSHFIQVIGSQSGTSLAAVKAAVVNGRNLDDKKLDAALAKMLAIARSDSSHSLKKPYPDGKGLFRDLMVALGLAQATKSARNTANASPSQALPVTMPPLKSQPLALLYQHCAGCHTTSLTLPNFLAGRTEAEICRNLRTQQAKLNRDSRPSQQLRDRSMPTAESAEKLSDDDRQRMIDALERNTICN